MNKLLVTLIAASLSALLLAVGCGAWLFWQSWEEGKRLERQNRELQASLEASRIRLDNFCEYPMEALCDVDGPRGTVSDAMAPLPAPATPQVFPAAGRPAEQPVPAASSAKKKTLPPADAGPQQESAASGKTPAEESAPPLRAALPSAAEAQKNGTQARNGRPAPSVPASDADATPSSDKTKKAPDSSEAPKVPDTEAAEIAPPSGKSTGEISEEKAADATPKKTWTTVERRAGSLTFRIAGAGPSLTGQGAVHEQPLRCEVTLPGLWNIAPRKVNTSLVQGMDTAFRNGDTVLTFPLAERPTLCEVSQEDARTIAIRLQ